jgi:hypothetical protein
VREYVFHSYLDIAVTINELWHSGNAHAWNQALERYMRFVKPADVELIRELEPLNLERIRELDAQGWYDFLFDKYFRWKYTAANRLATTRRSLSKYTQNGRIDELLSINLASAERLDCLFASSITPLLSPALQRLSSNIRTNKSRSRGRRPK